MSADAPAYPQPNIQLAGVSVVIPAWNAEATVGDAIASALSQTVAPLEVIVVDDGSLDRTADVVSSIDSPLVRLIRQENRGQSAALNRGVAESRGTYIKFLDADDLLNPHHLASQLEVLSGDQTMLASCRWGYFVDNPAQPMIRTEYTNRDYERPIEWIVDSLTMDEGMMGGWMWLIPRALWERAGGWDERLSLNNDFDFSIRLLLASSGIRYADDAVYSYREGVHGALSAWRSRAAMESAFNTTESGCRSLLQREDSPRIRRICADRWQRWIHQFYPDFPDLTERAEAEARRLGGSSLPLEGGRLLAVLLPLLGWKAVRQLQVRVYRAGWGSVLKWKAQRRLDAIRRAST